jgi:serine/threonine protein phosphatase PrpC
MVQPGPDKAESEDSAMSSKSKRFALVADGVGSGNGWSSAASRIVMNEMEGLIPDEGVATVREGLRVFERGLANAKYKIESFLSENNIDPASDLGRNIDSTIAMVMRTKTGETLVTSVGDSRVYARTKNGIELLTQDQSGLFRLLDPDNGINGKTEEEINAYILSALNPLDTYNKGVLNRANLTLQFLNYFWVEAEDQGGVRRHYYDLDAMKKFLEDMDGRKSMLAISQVELPVTVSPLSRDVNYRAQFKQLLTTEVYPIMFNEMANRINSSVRSGEYFTTVIPPRDDIYEIIVVSDGISDNLSSEEMDHILKSKRTLTEKITSLMYAAQQREDTLTGSTRFRLKPDDLGVAIIQLNQEPEPKQTAKKKGRVSRLFGRFTGNSNAA